MQLQVPLMQAHSRYLKESPRKCQPKGGQRVIAQDSCGVVEPNNRYYVSTHMNKMIVALVAGLLVSGAAFANEASAPVVASGASAAKATPHKAKAKKSKKSKAASAASAASAAQ